MNIGGLIGGLIAGGLGSLLWACIAYFGNVEIGWIAWGIGAAVGFGVSWGSSEGGPVAAGIAVLITIASLCGGKYMAVQMALNNIGDQVEQVPMEFTEVDCLMSLAYEEAEERAQRNELGQFRNGKRLGFADTLDDYPTEIQESVQKEWDSKTEEEKVAYREKIELEFKDALNQFKAEFSSKAFFESFGMFDLLFFGLGIYTAGQIAFADYVRD